MLSNKIIPSFAIKNVPFTYSLFISIEFIGEILSDTIFAIILTLNNWLVLKIEKIWKTYMFFCEFHPLTKSSYLVAADHEEERKVEALGQIYDGIDV